MWSFLDRTMIQYEDNVIDRPSPYWASIFSGIANLTDRSYLSPYGVLGCPETPCAGNVVRIYGTAEIEIPCSGHGECYNEWPWSFESARCRCDEMK
jgi:hypothetical protein